ncbi:MAG: TonB-dependent receptor [Acidobacteriia bacterium]|nr:TonB-dependent receptor [Terriglobia bacterium]
MNFFTRAFAFTLLCGLFFVPATFAQVNATVGGTVTDASGAVIVTAAVSAKNNSTGIVTNTTTNTSGAYEFASLQPGTYTVTATISGFKTATYNNVMLGQGQQARLNFNMEVAAAGETVSVVAEGDTVLATTSASVGGTLNMREVSNLPVASRNVLDLVTLTPGVIGVQGTFTAAGQTVPVFAGTATGNVNTTRDGMTTNDGRYNNSNGAYSGIFTSPDMVEEVRVSTNSIDPALGRGSAQVQMLTRSGGNEYHGALFYTNANSALSSKTYFQNLQGQPLDYYNRNQYGGRLGGPIVKNKAFFFALIDNQRYVQKVNVVSTVLTAEARQGIFRYLTAGSPGGTSRRNGNAFSSTPSVDINGNILKSAGGTPLFLNQFNVFSDVKDPNRTKIDPVWFGPQFLSRLPLPNNWTVGDGLNTAGFQFQRREEGIDGATGQSPSADRDHLTLRFDYQVNDKNKVNFVMSREHDWGVSSQSGQLQYPAGYIGDVQRRPRLYTAAWTSVITPSLLNEFRFGYKRDTWEGSSAFDQGAGYSGVSSDSLTQSSKDARASFPTINGQFQYIQPSTGTGTLGLGQYAQMNVASPRLTYSPMSQFADTVSWNHASHSFQGGFDMTREYSQSSNSGGTQTTRPSVSLGVGPTQVPNINSTNFAGLNANDVTSAQDLLANLAGTVASISQQYWINTPTDTNWSDYTKNVFFYREHHANQWASFFKDNWKVTRNLTVNLGIRYDFYGTPYESHGLAGKVVNPFGLSGTNYADAFGNRATSPGQITTIKFVNANSPNPGDTIYNNDWNNFAPSIGIAYQVPWFKRSTVLRAGYGINYTFAVDFLGLNTNIGNVPGTILNTANPVASYVSVQTLASSGLLPVSTQGTQPFAPVPVTNRSAGLNPYDVNLKTPYIQSFNIALQREITRSLTVDVSYIGNKATKLVTGRQINDVDIVDNGLLNAFNITRSGGNAPLFDTLLNGVNITGVGVVGQNGLTGSSALRRFTTTNAFIANGQVGSLANFLNTSAALGGLPGTILRKAGLPENFFVVNPQFGSMAYQSNNGNSTYNAGQVHFSQRLTHGLSAQGSYTFSKTLGDNTIRDQNNLRLSKGLLSIDRTHVIQEAFSYSVPFGKGGNYLTHLPNWADQAIGGWQISSGATWSSGIPLSFTGFNTLNQFGTATADLVGNLPSDYQQVLKGANLVNYFPTLTTKAAPVPNFGTGGDATTLTGRYTGQVVVDQNGNAVLANSQPGTTGNLAVNTPLLRGPGQLSFNGAVNKIFTITEGTRLTFRADVINLLNKPQWGNPVTDINSASFGRINSATGNRTITLNMRIDF